ncbi:molybdopterin-dependent oxidoreductase [Marinibacterium sp. SX1]|uniref:molybdopterin-dependent oxidoreductase n=1 Tax=Marinibacterium sp. SX1 TaxID=3388424 RepID=UPI003D180412
MLDWHEVRTQTAWTSGVHVFRGPLLRDVLALASTDPALRTGRLDMRAINDFEVTVPARDAWDHHPILARTMDGQMMRVRDKGPLWLVYPRDDNPHLQTAEFDERWIWQLSEIAIR